MMCVLLVGAIGTAEAAHIHGDWLPKIAAHASNPANASDGQGEEHCPLCVAMHSTLPVTIQIVPVPVLEVGSALTARIRVAPQKLWSFAMFSRPPPVAEPTLARHEASTDALRGVAAAG
jgi:hypothetical protein